MLFNTLQYIIFLPTVVIIYYLLPNKVRYIWLLIASYYFYIQWNPLYVSLLFSCTLLTYVGGIIIYSLREYSTGKKETEINKIKKKQKMCLAACIVLSLCILAYFKYFDFGILNLNRLLRLFHLREVGRAHDIVLPVGISFYTLQALGYLIDVYRGDICVEKNFLKYALFVSFFPQLVAGPIERSNNLLNQLNKSHKFEYENLRKGLLYILYGLFLKMVIADRAAIIVDTVYNDYAQYAGFYIVVAVCFFAIQIYCDFYGYSTIARGSALIMGIHLMDNFEAPYYAKSVKEFWRRWHISLSGWFRDYLYIPLGGNKKGKKKKAYNLMMVFGISGLWHGAALSYVMWGLLNGAYQVIAEVFMEIRLTIRKFFNKFMPNWIVEKDYIDADDKETECFSKKLFRTIMTFFMITFTWLFFRAESLREAFKIITNILPAVNWTILFDGSLYNLGVERNYIRVLIVSIVFLFIVDYHKYRGIDMADWLLKQGCIFRILIIMIILFTILLYGCYGRMYDIQQFIYFQF